jgi:VWFA-related protein
MRTLVMLLALVAGSVLAYPASAQTSEQTAFVSVLDRNGQPVAGLDVGDFVVKEDGRAREVLRAGRTSDPIDLAVIVDNSFAAQPTILDLRKALMTFLEKMTTAQASVALVGLADRPTVLLDYTSSAVDAKKGVERIFAQPGSGTVFQDAIVETLNGLSRRDNPRRAALVITGEGTDFSNLKYQNTLDVIRGSGAALHVLVLTTPSTPAAVRDDNARERNIVIDEGTRATGGRRQELLSSMAFGDALNRVAEDLANQYKVVFGRPAALVPPRTFEVSVTRPGLTARGTLVRAKSGGTK